MQKVFESCPKYVHNRLNQMEEAIFLISYFLCIRGVQSSLCSVWDWIVNWLTLSKQEILKLIKEMSLSNLDKTRVRLFFFFFFFLSHCTVNTLGACHRLV